MIIKITFSVFEENSFERKAVAKLTILFPGGNSIEIEKVIDCSFESKLSSLPPPPPPFSKCATVTLIYCGDALTRERTSFLSNEQLHRGCTAVVEW